MKIDLEQEKFLARLDMRLATISATMNYFEKWLASVCAKNSKQSMDWQRQIDEMTLKLQNSLKEQDKKIVEHFENLEKQLKGENGNGKSN